MATAHELSSAEDGSNNVKAACGRLDFPHAQNGDVAGVRTLPSRKHASTHRAIIVMFVALACFAAAIPLCLLLMQLRADALEAAVDRRFSLQETHAAR